jgi:hypothetical protein
MKRSFAIAAVVALFMAMAAPAWAGGPPPKEGDGPGSRVRVTVYVESQGLFYDSIVGPSLPANGPFQELRPGEGPGGSLATDFGPGDQGFVGGRWWIDVNGNDEMDAGDMFFSCPLLGKGSASPPA